MMRSWGNRPDTVVCDEPFYAHYLATTGLDHPGRTEVLEDLEAQRLLSLESPRLEESRNV